MAVETGLIGRALSILGSLVGALRTRQNAKRWTGCWQAYQPVGRELAGPIQGAGPAYVSLRPWWTVSGRLTFDCSELDAQGRPTRRQTGYILVDANDPDAATRRGRYLDSAEAYEQRLRMLDNDTILIIPVAESSTLGDVYAKHAWRRKR